ncbi:hypothetical protein ACIQPR_44085 [Streptomyces sp. NPDC091280]|uniref:hypothetical protein n=1 Tax=Streptomyces sp. NPDC091280 TaxID=3365984 RepID=UPI003821CD18
MSRIPDPPREELRVIGAFVKARMLDEAQTAVAGRWPTRTAAPELVAVAVALVSSRAMLAEMLADTDYGDNRIRAIVAPLHEMAEQGKTYTHFQSTWPTRQLDALFAQPKLAPRRARTS